ncbi:MULTISPECIES: RloB family protein [unclassified Coleofasciculus]|uniref:RloB family protein n=1 Tax=unclassified Coleofasciculus TaxID=2692782 RepID=UPI00187FB295|nr:MULTISPECIES: RloB family protein [unclassified Coleofasciculus]MBE9125551.1 RloB domain-containing protein [Coleofasciculus sp. LEGE 07081]MBE9147814.1 RloB domain-containing protein [Coleofasciculus sp. LEGE 07092]
MSKKGSSRKQDKSSSRKSYRGYSERTVETRELIERFLIVCEGEKTEPNYFKSFRVPKDVVDIYGVGENTINLVKKAIELKEKDDYDQVWCVFDRDEFPAENFNAALTVARNNNIKVAYSNEAFELWYLLHFNYHDTAIPRKDYTKKLTEQLGHEYKKNSETIYEELESKQQTAIKNAKKLLTQYVPPNPESDNPSTTVHLLVEQLNRFIR